MKGKQKEKGSAAPVLPSALEWSLASTPFSKFSPKINIRYKIKKSFKI
jgi:hypothetical protein